MNYSLNEVEAVIKRATYASGYSWGLAEEAAKATRWLCIFGFDGCEIVGSILKKQFAKDLSCHSPNCSGHQWSGDKVLCPLITGVTLSDFSSRLLASPIIIQNISVPQMILPFVSLSAQKLGKALTTKWGNNLELKCMTNGSDVEILSKFSTDKTDLFISVEGEIKNPISKVNRVQPSKQAWKQLNDLANLTYAPATEESRKLGAGSEAGDND